MPRLSPTLYNPSRPCFEGNRAATIAYPGRKSINGIPIIIRTPFEGANMITMIRTRTRRLMTMRSPHALTLNGFAFPHDQRIPH